MSYYDELEQQHKAVSSELLTQPILAIEITGFSAAGVRTNMCPVF
jgi:hypothetical protein